MTTPRMVPPGVLAGVVLTPCLVANALGQATITAVLPLPSDLNSYAQAVSRDGLVVVGRSDGSMEHAFRWSAARGTEDLGQIPEVGSAHNAPAAVSDDGTVVVGFAGDLNTLTLRGFRWTLSGGMVDLGGLDSEPHTFTFAYGLSGDGSIVVGNSGPSGFRWDPATLMTQVSGLGAANVVSGDGSVIAGRGTAGGTVRWTSSGGAQPIGNFLVTGMSDSGDVVVGYSGGQPQGAIRWTAQGGAVLLPVPQGSPNVYARAISGDASVIVGSIERTGGGGACIWLGSGVGAYLHEYLPTLGLDLTGWQLNVAWGVNDDGSVIVGDGFFNGESRGWVVHLRPGCGTADFNHDGDTGTDADIEAFFACLAGSCCATCYTADFNNDGDTGTDADIEAFFRVLAGGSC